MSDDTLKLTCHKCELFDEKVVPATWALTHRPCGHVKGYCNRHHAAAVHAFEDVEYVVCGEHTPWLRCTGLRWDKLA